MGMFSSIFEKNRYLCLARNLRNPKKDIAVGVRIYAFF